jgi:hypothetical protein
MHSCSHYVQLLVTVALSIQKATNGIKQNFGSYTPETSGDYKMSNILDIANQIQYILWPGKISPLVVFDRVTTNMNAGNVFIGVQSTPGSCRAETSSSRIWF